MSNFFPRHTIAHPRVEEPSAFRRISFSLVEMAVIAGVLLRIYRSFVLTHGSNSWLYLGGSFALGLVFLLAMLTMHLANYTLRRWVWRVPLFGVVELAAEMATSLFLIWLGREPNGTVRATLGDWPAMVGTAFAYRFTAVLIWALVLAGAVTIVRRTMVHQDESDDEDDEAVPHLEERNRSASGSQVLL